MKEKKFSLKHRKKSFKYAFEGVKTLFKEEHNARIHLVAAFAAITLSIYYQISAIEWSLVIFTIVLVFTMEIFNTAIENLADFITIEKSPKIKIIKDLSAAAVLFAALGAAIIACLIFIPKIF